MKISKKIKKLKAESVGFQKLLNKYDIKQLTQKQNEYNQKIKTITNQMKNELNQLFEEKKIVQDQLIEIDKKLKHNRILIKNLKDPRNKTIVQDSLNKFNKQKKETKQNERLINEQIKNNDFYKQKKLKSQQYREKAITRKIHLHRISNEPIIEENVSPVSLLEDEENEQELSQNLSVNFKAQFKNYANLETTRYKFDVSDDTTEEFIKKIKTYRREAIRHFCAHNHIRIKFNNTNDYYKNVTDKYFIGERVTANFPIENDVQITRTVLLEQFFETLHQYEKYAVPLIYDIYFIKKPVSEGGCDCKEHKSSFELEDKYQGVNDKLYCKSMKSKDHNCAIAIFTNALNKKVNPNHLRKELGLEINTHITVDQLDLLIDYFKCDVTLYKQKDSCEMIKRTDRHEKKIEILLDNKNHYWLVLKHDATKNYGICEECGVKKNCNHHKCSLDVIRSKNMVINNDVRC